MAESTPDALIFSSDAPHAIPGAPGAELSIEEIKRVELETLVAFDAFAKAHELTYWLFYGTLLGAARHGGFIPWDDDIDVVMPKSDYYRLVDLTNSGAAIGEHWALNAPSVEGAVCTRPFGKVFDTRTVAEENELYPIPNLAESVWIDVFPLVGLDDPDGALPTSLRTFDFNFGMLRRAVFKFTKGSDFAGTARRLLAWVPAHVAGYRRWLNACESAQKDMPDQFDGAWCTAPSETQYMYPTELFGDRDADTVRLTFEGLEFPVPAQWEKVLELRYGDWRTPPPESERVSLHDFAARWAG